MQSEDGGNSTSSPMTKQSNAATIDRNTIIKGEEPTNPIATPVVFYQKTPVNGAATSSYLKHRRFLYNGSYEQATGLGVHPLIHHGVTSQFTGGPQSRL